MSPTLRAFAREDAAEILNWVGSARELEFWCGRDDFPLRDEAIFEEWHRDPDITGYGLADGEELVAYGETWLEEAERFAELGRLIVARERRGSGLGRRLVVELCARIDRDVFPAVHVRVHPDNERALCLYRRCGFQDVAKAEQQELNRGQSSWCRWLQFRFPASGLRVPL